MYQKWRRGANTLTECSNTPRTGAGEIETEGEQNATPSQSAPWFVGLGKKLTEQYVKDDLLSHKY